MWQSEVKKISAGTGEALQITECLLYCITPTSEMILDLDWSLADDPTLEKVIGFQLFEALIERPAGDLPQRTLERVKRANTIRNLMQNQ